MWLVLAKSATGRSPRNTGVTTVKSFKWPVACHGSLVTSTSPGTSVYKGCFAKNLPTAAAIALTWPGVPVTAWASMAPRVSKTPADKSPASRTTVENAVRISVCACSSTMARSRFQINCVWSAAWPAALTPAPFRR